MKPARQTAITLSCLLLLASPCLYAQSRKQVTLSSPRAVGKGVAGSSFSHFRTYSAGSGNLSRQNPLQGGGGALDYTMSRSNRGLSVGIQQQQYNPNVSPVRPMTSTSTSVRRSPASGTGQMGLPSVSPTAPPSSRSSRPNRRYSSDLTTPDYLRTPDLPQHSQPDSFEDRYVVIDPHQEIMRQLSAGNSTASHLAALQGLDDDADLNPLSETDHLASLAPERPGMLQRAMLRGEAAFREGDYRTALSAFSTAMALSYRSPEALLSLARTEFAAGQYRLGGMHIAEALQVLPELVLLDIQPQNYYDEVDLYHDHRAALEERVANEPWNFETNLLLAYHRLRADRLDEVREPLSRALALAKFQNNEDAEDAVLILWDGLQARNPGPGKLQPAELPDLFKPLDENDINKTSEAG